MPASPEHFDAVVIGSGFGGAVPAYRLASAGKLVCLLERGNAYPPNSFPRTPYRMKDNLWDPSEGKYGLYNLWAFKGIDAVVSSGLGGGSLIYANVLLRKDERWFDPTWPFTRKDLDPHYAEVESMMGVQTYPFEHAPYRDTPKTRATREAASRLNLGWQLPPLAVIFANRGEAPVVGEPIQEAHPNLHGKTRTTCRLCGECVVGCNYGSKNTLDYTYLSAAKRLGADIRTFHEVRNFAPRPGGGFTIGYVRHDTGRAGEKTETSRLPLEEMTADKLILAAGTFGSTYLLLKNRSAFPHLSRVLGTRFSGNGDLLGIALRARRRKDGREVPRPIEPVFGPAITSAIRMADALDGGTGRGFYVEDAGYPAFLNWLAELGDSSRGLRRFLHFVWRWVSTRLALAPDTDVGAEVSALLGDADFSSSSLPLLGMGRDVPDGNMTLNEGRLQLDWTRKSSREYFERLRHTMKEIATQWNAQFLDNPLWYLGQLITVHPLGGCPAGRDVNEGVVSPFGEVWGHPGLYVTDGAAMPGPVGPNPALTIAAFADRAALRILGQ